MIPIIKGPAPSSLEEAKSQRKQDVKLFGKHGAKTRILSSKKSGTKKQAGVIYITALYRANDVKVALVRSHFGKCVYCETQILTISHGDVEHFRPKSEYTSGVQDDSGLGYFWLAYDWANLFLACQTCNETYKGTYFELMPGVDGLAPPSGRMAVDTDVFSSTERAVLINPELENPRYFIQFDPGTGVLSARETPTFFMDSARVGKMVTALGLNRPSLIAARQRYAVFLRSLFIQAIADLPTNAKHRELLVHAVTQLDKLKKEPKGEDARGIQEELTKHCQGVYTHEGALQPGGALNPAEAMKWLHFCITPRAEYTALAQDCLLTWVPALTSTLQSVMATTQTTGMTPSGSGGHTTTRDTSWPPLLLPPVRPHLERLEAAEREFVEKKTKEMNDAQEALREYYYNEVNTLVAGFDAFQKKFVSADAEERYLEWYIDLDHCNDKIEEVGGKSKEAERQRLLELLDEELTKISRGQLGPLEARLRKFSEEHVKYFQMLQTLQPSWKAVLDTFTAAEFLMDDMLMAMRTAPALDPGPTPPDAYALPDALQVFHQELGPSLAALSAGLKLRTQALQERVDALRKSYEELDIPHRRGACVLLGQPPQRCQQWMAQVSLCVRNLKGGLGKVLQEAFDQRAPHAAECEKLWQGFAETGLDTGTWQREQISHLMSLVIDLEEAMKGAAPAFVPDNASTWTRTLPPVSSTPPPTYVPVKQVKQGWSISTAKTQLDAFWAGRAKLKRPRALTKKQQAQCDELTQRDQQLRTVYQKLITFTESELFAPSV
ncbi:hypothetical protein HPC49_25015 [Pyxidicoccus fallax]|uniref:Uncharacterized protein n=1 Tax=Pyxidicoccus fallax TaxID=394095 RepID=A0A848LKS3_9BACT|nr:hypothetical protein [Pyxidicoccus fallax]NMO18387.1 hypothetical protein [Pyxidicoccus fallax]NPC81476.1 hypothetical protein [Pyxidicoccus fallax]